MFVGIKKYNECKLLIITYKTLKSERNKHMTTYSRVNFNEFIKSKISLNNSLTIDARRSRDFLYSQLKELPNKVEYFPKLYPDNPIYNYGSFSRKTKIRPLDDIDFLYIFAADGCSYYNISNDEVVISVPESSENLRKLLNTDGFLSSRRLANKIKDNISNVSQYRNAEIRSNQEAIILSLSSYDWTFDIIPAFITAEEEDGRSYFLIPNGRGNWKKTDPRIDKERATTLNQAEDLNVLEFIRVIKFWFKNHRLNVSSYLIEILVLKYIEENHIFPLLKLELQYFFKYLHENINYSINDPKGLQGNLNDLTLSKRISIQNKAKESEKAVEEARTSEGNGDYFVADTKWKVVFGDSYA